MVAQLSQLTGVEKLTGINDTLTQMQNANSANMGLQSSNLIGRSVTANTNTLTLDALNSPQGRYQLQAAAGTVSVQVNNADGTTVRTLNAGAQALGNQQFQWDGKDDKGVRATAGAYSFQVVAKDAKGNTVPTSTEVSGRVTEVTYANGAAAVVVDGAQVPLSNVTSIAQ
jgi:flagellar basal-body rod modification protein FlgD